jgi:fructosamine-3-kinase
MEARLKKVLENWAEACQQTHQFQAAQAVAGGDINQAFRLQLKNWG